MDMIANEDGAIKILKSDARWFGVTYREDKQFAIEKINDLVKNGKYPINLWA
jgi:hypothetical protein